MNIRKRLITTAIILSLLLPISVMLVVAENSSSTKYEVKGERGFLIREERPDGSIHAFSYSGDGVFALDKKAKVSIKVDPIANTGEVKASWKDPDGDKWKLVWTTFSAPDHPSGLVFEDIIGGTPVTSYILGDPIAINHYEHGTTGAGAPVLPTVFIYLSAWGVADVYKDGEFLGEFEAHFMVSDGARDEYTGIIWNADQTAPYSPMNPADGYVDPDDVEVHLVFHTPAGPYPGPTNFPPPYSFFYHIQFEDVEIEATQPAKEKRHK